MVTIVIPIYNQIKFMRRSIESSVNQTYSNLQIILVDDGSTDGSDKICDEYAIADKRIEVIHKRNGGLSSARNAGLEIMKGTYVTFLDSDDYLSNDFVERAVTLCENNNADISILDMKYICENVNSEEQQYGEKNISVFTSEQAIEESLYQVRFSCCAPGKLYKRKIFEEIRFPLQKLSEDLAISHKVLNKADLIVFSDRIGYYYRQQGKSIMHVFSSNRMDALQWVHEIETFCEKSYPNIIAAAKCRTFNVATHLLLDIPEKDESEKKYGPILWKDIKRTRFNVLVNSKVRFREKAAAILSFGGTRLLRKVWNSRFAIKK